MIRINVLIDQTSSCKWPGGYTDVSRCADRRRGRLTRSSTWNKAGNSEQTDADQHERRDAPRLKRHHAQGQIRLIRAAVHPVTEVQTCHIRQMVQKFILRKISGAINHQKKKKTLPSVKRTGVEPF